jgi:asparagine synthase (glutamine-hydrolysing)
MSDRSLHDFARGLAESLADKSVTQGSYVRRLFSEQLPAHPGYYGEMVWILLMLGQWLEVKAPGWKL